MSLSFLSFLSRSSLLLIVWCLHHSLFYCFFFAVGFDVVWVDLAVFVGLYDIPGILLAATVTNVLALKHMLARLKHFWRYCTMLIVSIGNESQYLLRLHILCLCLAALWLVQLVGNLQYLDMGCSWDLGPISGGELGIELLYLALQFSFCLQLA